MISCQNWYFTRPRKIIYQPEFGPWKRQTLHFAHQPLDDFRTRTWVASFHNGRQAPDNHSPSSRVFNRYHWNVSFILIPWQVLGLPYQVNHGCSGEFWGKWCIIRALALKHLERFDPINIWIRFDHAKISKIGHWRHSKILSIGAGCGCKFLCPNVSWINGRLIPNLINCVECHV